MVKKAMDNESKLVKIIYFDEHSATDYMQIIKGGQLTKTTELFDGKKAVGGTGAKGEASAGIGGVFKKLTGYGASVEVSANLNASFEKNTLVRTMLQNTILTDFLETVNEDATDIEKFENIQINVIENSLGYIIMVSPYMKMIEGNNLKINDDMNLDLSKIDNTIKDAKGYFEVEGIADDKVVIIRFNIECFKNNYKISDLLKMNLTVYAVEVGETIRSNISIESEINVKPKKDKNIPKYGEDKDEQPKKDSIKVYDAFLAGVAKHE